MKLVGVSKTEGDRSSVLTIFSYLSSFSCFYLHVLVTSIFFIHFSYFHLCFCSAYFQKITRSKYLQFGTHSNLFLSALKIEFLLNLTLTTIPAFSAGLATFWALGKTYQWTPLSLYIMFRSRHKYITKKLFCKDSYYFIKY